MPRILHDTARCAGLGVCESIASDYFEVGDDGELVVLRADVTAQDTALVGEAIDACPTQALSWSD